MLDNYIENLKDEIVEKTRSVIQIPSVYSDINTPSMPFGKNVNDALEYVLNLGKSLGFRTKNLDGYCGYIEFGEGKEMLGIIGHLDVVPEGEGWIYPPFSGAIHDGKIFGRGAIDDKSAVIASLYAMKAVMDKYKVDKRVRLILGLNEERDWKCIDHYKKSEEMPDVAFSPDADFPCIYAEKSILNCSISSNYFANEISNVIIKEIDCNNNALNVVPKICTTTLIINKANISIDDLIHFINLEVRKNNFEIDVLKINNNEIKLTSKGVQAHGAHPDLGVNAISRLIIILNKIFNFCNENNEILDFFSKYINIDYYGKNLSLNFKDESGKLTLNVGHFLLKNSKLEIKMNIRIPVTIPANKVEQRFIKLCNLYKDLNFKEIDLANALYIPKDNKLVSTLCRIFNEYTNSNYEPVAIGGGTYAKAFNNCISFGPNFPGHEDMCHKTDEFIEINNLILCSKIYAKAILELASKNFKIQ